MLRRVKMKSRCQVGGKVYLPGDEALVTDAQYAYLLTKDAVTFIPMLHTTPQLPPDQRTPEGLKAFYLKLFGEPLP